MPDIDVDFCFERRGEVIEYVRQKYGRESVGQIVTFGTMKPGGNRRSARVLDPAPGRPIALPSSSPPVRPTAFRSRRPPRRWTSCAT